MKFTRTILLGTALVLALAGCASTGEAAKPSAAPAASPAATAADKPAAAPDFKKSVQVIPLGAALPEGTVELVDGFEEGEFWTAVGDSWDQWGAHNLSLVASLTSEKGVTEGANAYEWAFDVIKSGALATFYTDQPPFTDFSGVKYIVIDVLNPLDVPVSLVFSCQTTDSWTWSQTASGKVRPGHSTVVFKMGEGSKVFPGLDLMKRLMFSINDARGKNGSIFVDNIRVVR